MINKPGKVVKIRILNEVHMMIVGLHGDHLMHFYERYALLTANYFFNPKYKLGQWDGKIRYFNKDGRTYLFLLEEILPQLYRFGYKVEVEDVRETEAYQPDTINENIFAHILHPDSQRPIILRDYQVEAVNVLIEHGFGVCVAGTGAGKANSLNTKILTTVGWVRMGDITLDHYVITPSNTPAKVIGIFPQGKKDIYEIKFHDGASNMCCLDHLWKVKFPKQLHKAWTDDKIVTTSEIISFLHRKNSGIHTPGNVSIPLCNPISYFHQETSLNNMPNPYLLGLLIGDGHIGKTSITMTSADLHIIDNMQELLTHYDLQITKQKYGKYGYAISNSTKYQINRLLQQLKELKLSGCRSWEKFIPEPYKWATIENRLELIRGLMDTDGTVDKRGNCSYTTTSQQLALDVQDITRSLGCTCTITTRTPSYTYNGIKKQGRTSYTCFIRCSDPSMLFNLPRKKERCSVHNSRIELTRRVKDIRLVGHEEAQCIMIDHPDHLYITDDYVVTHNTFMCAALVTAHDKLNIKSITIVPDQTLIRQTKRDYINCGLDTGEYSGTEKTLNHKHIVSTWQALKNNPQIMNTFDMVIVDECHGLRGNVLQKIICEHASRMSYRFGFTGTLPKDASEKMLVHIAVGPERYTIPAHELQDRGVLSTIQIDILQLEEDLTKEYEQWCAEENMGGKPPTYTEFKDSYFGDFSAEKSYVQRKQSRIEWIADAIQIKADQKKGNVLCLVDSIPTGRQIVNLIPGSIFVNGQDVKDAKKRQKIYDMFATHDNLVVVATVHIAGTGLSINRIFNLMFIDIGKSFIRVIQAIGRGLRMDDDKNHVSCTDICSDLKYGKKHLAERIKYYKEARYPHKKTKIKYNHHTEELEC